MTTTYLPRKVPGGAAPARAGGAGAGRGHRPSARGADGRCRGLLPEALRGDRGDVVDGGVPPRRGSTSATTLPRPPTFSTSCAAPQERAAQLRRRRTGRVRGRGGRAGFVPETFAEPTSTAPVDARRRDVERLGGENIPPGPAPAHPPVVVEGVAELPWPASRAAPEPQPARAARPRRAGTRGCRRSAAPRRSRRSRAAARRGRAAARRARRARARGADRRRGRRRGRHPPAAVRRRERQAEGRARRRARAADPGPPARRRARAASSRSSGPAAPARPTSPATSPARTPARAACPSPASRCARATPASELALLLSPAGVPMQVAADAAERRRARRRAARRARSCCVDTPGVSPRKAPSCATLQRELQAAGADEVVARPAGDDERGRRARARRRRAASSARARSR